MTPNGVDLCLQFSFLFMYSATFECYLQHIFLDCSLDEVLT